MLTTQSMALGAAVANLAPAPSEYELLQSKRYGFFYYKIAKCGSTFVKRVINNLDGAPPRKETDQVLWGDDGRVAFAIVRKPIDRFLSLYFDKLLGGPSFMAKDFLRRGLINPNATTLQEHSDNCHRALGWINASINGGSKKKINYHWRPQVRRLYRISNMNVQMLTLDGLSWQLPYILNDTCPQISHVMQVCGKQNVSPKPIHPKELATVSLRRQISRIYAADERVYAEVNRHWAKIGESLGHHGQDIKQTARGWLVTDRQACGHHIQRSC